MTLSSPKPKEAHTPSSVWLLEHRPAARATVRVFAFSYSRTSYSVESLSGVSSLFF